MKFLQQYKIHFSLSVAHFAWLKPPDFIAIVDTTFR